MNHFLQLSICLFQEIFFNFLGFVAVLLSKSGDCYHADSCSSSCSGFCISTRVDRWRQISSIRRSTSMQYRQSSGRRGLHPAQVWHVVCDMWNELKWQKTQWNNEEIGNSILSSTIACGIVRHTLCINDFPETSHLVIKPNRRHRVVVIDDFFSHEALQELRDFLLESTIWTDVKRGAPAETNAQNRSVNWWKSIKSQNMGEVSVLGCFIYFKWAIWVIWGILIDVLMILHAVKKPRRSSCTWSIGMHLLFDFVIREGMWVPTWTRDLLRPW